MFRKRKKEIAKNNRNSKKTILDIQIRDLYNDLEDLDMIRFFFVSSFIIVIILILYIDLDLLSKLLKHSPGGKLFWIYAILTFMYFIFGLLSIKYLNRFIRKTRKAYEVSVKEREAEKKIQKFLEDNLAEGYYLFKNIYTGYGDIDAIIVGPTGIYIIEIKSNSGLIGKNSNGYLTVVDGNSPNKNYRDQVIKESMQVKKYIENNVAGSKFWVNPILVFPFGEPMNELVLDSNFDNYKVPVLKEKDLLKHIYSNVQNKLTKEQIENIVKAIEEWQKDWHEE